MENITLLKPEHMLYISLAIGGVIRFLKTETMSTWLDRLPVSWINRIPKDWLPWLALFLAMIVSVVDARIQGDAKTWQSAIAVTIQGVMSGSLAIAGHETLAKTVGKVVKLPPPGTSIFMLIFTIFTAIAILTATPGCGAVISALPSVIAVIVDAGQILDTISSFCEKWFIDHPDPTAQKKVADALVKARSALNVLLRAANGAQDVNDAKVNDAFEQFKQAYLELLNLVQPYGVTVSPSENFPRLGVGAEGKLVVPPPLAFAPRGAK